LKHGIALQSSLDISSRTLHAAQQRFELSANQTRFLPNARPFDRTRANQLRPACKTPSIIRASQEINRPETRTLRKSEAIYWWYSRRLISTKNIPNLISSPKADMAAAFEFLSNNFDLYYIGCLRLIGIFSLYTSSREKELPQCKSTCQWSQKKLSFSYQNYIDAASVRKSRKIPQTNADRYVEQSSHFESEFKFQQAVNSNMENDYFNDFLTYINAGRSGSSKSRVTSNSARSSPIQYQTTFRQLKP